MEASARSTTQTIILSGLHKIPLEGECHVPQEELKHDLRVLELILRWQGRYYEKLGENVHHHILFFYMN